MSQTDKLLAEISEKLDKMLRLLAVQAVEGIAIEQKKIELLDSLDFRPIEIAKLLNKSPDNVNVQLNILRKKKVTKPQSADKVETDKNIEDISNTSKNLQKEIRNEYSGQ